jgi:hypothetical protein
MLAPAVLAPVIFVAACGGNDSTGIPDACNPLGGQGCLMPWPSMAYVKTDASSATGYRVDIPIEAMPANLDKLSVDPGPLNRRDGFSPISQLLVAFPTGVSGDNLPTWKDPSASLAADSPIVIVAIDNGERVPFFAEIDQNIDDITKRDLIIRPLARMRGGTKYAVGIRNTVVAPDGSALPISPGFKALRDGGSFNHPKFAAFQKEASDTFGALATAGVAKSELVLAWDFVTASDEFLQQDLTTMRDAAIPAIGAVGANLTFTTVAQPPIANIYKSYVGTYKSPTFLDNGEADTSIIARDAAGLPMLVNMRDANFAALIPQCVTTATLPRPTIIFGHGLFGSAKGYLSDGFVQSLAEQYCFIIIAGDFIGLTERQIPLAPLAVNDMNRAPQIAEKLGQAVIDFIALENAARGPMAASDAFKVNGASVIDPAQTFYVGGSLGGIMGNTFMAYDPNLTRGVLAVPGGDWSLLFERSNAWHLLQGAAQGSYTDPEVYQLNIAFLGMSMEPYDPITTAAHVIHDPLPGVPAKNILIWYAIGDCLVSNIATEIIARTMGISVLAPSVKSPWGLTPTAGPLANGVNVFDDHPTPLPPDTNVPPAQDNGTHSGINRKPAALRLIQTFLFQDTITPACEVSSAPAPCDCATGACS